MVVEQVGPLYVEKVYQWNVDNLGEMRRSNGHNLTLASFLARFLGPPTSSFDSQTRYVFIIKKLSNTC